MFLLSRILLLSFAAFISLGIVFSGEPKFKKIVVSDKFHAEGASYGDFNKDGKFDVVIGHFWYEGPNFKTSHQIFEGQDFDPKDYSECFGMFTGDFNGDDWSDILVCPHPGKDCLWYENPKNKEGLWEKHLITPELGNESQEFADILGFKRKQILFNKNNWLGLAIDDPKNSNAPWEFLPISIEDKKFQRYTHGLGYGDVNGDSRIDILEKDGWYEQPADYKKIPWTFHPFSFADAASHILVYDVDGDGLNDVVTAIHCHLYGFAWYRQVRSDGKITFEKNELIPQKPGDDFFPKVSQLHAMALADMNGDGIPDVITGKRFWAHGPKGDVAPDDPAYLMWWETKRTDGKASLIPHIIDDNSGVGTQFAVGDLNGDGKPDIITGNKKGAFVFMSE